MSTSVRSHYVTSTSIRFCCKVMSLIGSCLNSMLGTFSRRQMVKFITGQGSYLETSLSPPVIFLLPVPRRYFFCGSFYSCLSLLYCLVCVMQPFGHLLRKGRILGSPVCDVFLWICHFPMRYPGSGVALDCIDSWSLLLPYFVVC